MQVCTNTVNAYTYIITQIQTFLHYFCLKAEQEQWLKSYLFYSQFLQNEKFLISSFIVQLTWKKECTDKEIKFVYGLFNSNKIA